MTIKRSSKQSIDVLSALVSEREKYEQWIAALLDKKASTPAKVFDRVYADYTSRLEAVMEELGARGTELDGQVEGLRTKSAELLAQEEKLREEHAEAELRHTIGEHTADQWREIVGTHNTAVGKLSAERSRIDAELESLQRIMAGIHGDAGGSTAPPSRPAPAVASPAPAAPAPAVPAPPPAAPPRTPTPAASSASLSAAQVRAEEEKTRWGGAPPVKGEAAASPPPPPPKRTPASTASAELAKTAGDAPAPKRQGEPGFDELAFLKSVVPEGQPDGAAGRPGRDRKLTGPQSEVAITDRRPGADAPAAKAAEPPKAPADTQPVEQLPVSTKADPMPTSGTERPVSRDANAPLRSSRIMNESDIGAIGGIENLSEGKVAANETPTFLKNVPQEQAKTLKCGECGAMNYATEWYCERCGAELSAL